VGFCLFMGFQQLMGQFQLVVPVICLFLSDGADYPAGVTGSNDSGWDVLGDDGTCADHRIVADGHTGADNSAAADPNIAADGDGNGIVIMSAANHRVNGVVDCINSDLGTQHNLVTDGDVTTVQKYAVIIAVKILTYPDIPTVVTMERRLDVGAVTGFGKQLLGDFTAFGAFSLQSGIQEPGQTLGVVVCIQKLFVQRVEITVQLQLTWIHGKFLQSLHFSY